MFFWLKHDECPKVLQIKHCLYPYLYPPLKSAEQDE